VLFTAPGEMMGARILTFGAILVLWCLLYLPSSFYFFFQFEILSPFLFLNFDIKLKAELMPIDDSMICILKGA
jgi:hypothetical protein